MLCLGKDPQPSWAYPPLTPQGYADPALYGSGARDPIPAYARKLEAMSVIGARSSALQRRGRRHGGGAGARGNRRAWPDRAGHAGCHCRRPFAARAVEILGAASTAAESALSVRTRRRSTRRSMTFLEAVMHGVSDALDADPRAFVFGRTLAANTVMRFSCFARCSRSTAIALSIRRWPKARCLAPALDQRWPASARSARCNSTTLWRRASTSS